MDVVAKRTVQAAYRAAAGAAGKLCNITGQARLGGRARHGPRGPSLFALGVGDGHFTADRSRSASRAVVAYSGLEDTVRQLGVDQ
jgi:hypothetical protein